MVKQSEENYIISELCEERMGRVSDSVDRIEKKVDGLANVISGYERGIAKVQGVKMTIFLLVAFVSGLASFLLSVNVINSTIDKTVVPKLVRIVNEQSAAAFSQQTQRAAPKP